MLRPGQSLSLLIEKPAAGGRMIARSEGQVILVSGVIPGEVAKVLVERVGKGVAYGRTVELEEPSPDRRAPFVDPLCGGCLYSHIDYSRQLAIKSQVIVDALIRIGRIDWREPVLVAASADHGYRMRSRAHVRGGRVGFFREGSHDLCDVRATRQLLDDTCDLLDRLGERIQRAGLVDCEIEISENLNASERVIHLESQSAAPRATLAGLAGDDGLTGVTVGRPHTEGASMTPATVVAGTPYVTDLVSAGGQEFLLRRHVLSFFQGNRFLLKDLVSHVAGQIGAGEDVVDLYAGVGLFAIESAIARDARVTAVEGDRHAAADLTENAAQTDGRVIAVHQSVEAFVESSRPRVGVVIVDPPRTGMSRESLAGVVGLSAGRIVYVSCDVATLARDARRLIDAGYDIRRIDGFDLFPNTPHVETVVVFDRRI